MKNLLWAIIILFGVCSCGSSGKVGPADTATGNPWQNLTDQQLLDTVQYHTFKYFWDFAEPNSGLARERFIPSGNYPMNDSHIVTSGGTGFGVMALLVGIERGFISREEGIERLTKIVDFLEKADRFHGIWPHWMNGETGKVKPFSKKDDGGDLVESAFLMQGLLCVRQYCDQKNAAEKALAEKINTLWREMEWNWYTQGGQDSLYWHWSPNYGWEMDFPLAGYNECLITFVLGASSPTHPIDAGAYHKCWARDGAIVANDQYLGYDRILDYYANGDSPVGPLFWAHYSYLGLNPKALTDQYADYWQLNQNQTLMHHKHALDNPNDFKGYGKNCWGMTSSYTRKEDGGVGYTAHRPDRDMGIISPTAALSSFPYTPEKSMQALRGFYETYGEQLIGPAGPYDAFSPHHDWVVERYLAIDQGPIPVMIENHRSGLLWDLFMSCSEVKEGLARLGFFNEIIPL